MLQKQEQRHPMSASALLFLTAGKIFATRCFLQNYVRQIIYCVTSFFCKMTS